MRVISGKYRGKTILSPVGNDVRPTSDKVKESIFNVIQWDIANSRFVDLFSGSGNVGIEALSRGAKEVVFVDINRNSISLIKENLEKIDDNYNILNRDFKDALNSLSGKWDFVFVDAPYNLDCINQVCEIVERKQLLSDDGYIIYEHDDNMVYELSNNWMIGKTKQFSKTYVDYIQKCNSVCAVTGSFDPITLGHWDIIMQASTMYDKVDIVIANNDQKTSLFDMQQRKEIVQQCCKDYPNISVHICDGWVYEYCNQHNIKDIVRGYRDDADMTYEQEMALFNKEKGGLDTHLIKANDQIAQISSTAVREALKADQSIKNFVPKDVIGLIKKFYNQK